MDMEKGYILTKLGREHGYAGLLKESEIDDAVRATFTILREEDVPGTTEYISLRIGHLSKWDVEDALRKLIHVNLVKELE